MIVKAWVWHRFWDAVAVVTMLAVLAAVAYVPEVWPW